MTQQLFLANQTSLWSTENAFTFTQRTLPTALGAIPSIAVHNGKLFMVARPSSAVSIAKCWVSSDKGATWSELSTLPTEYGTLRNGSTSRLISFSGSLWIVGGISQSLGNDILRSDNEGVTWTVASPATLEDRSGNKHAILGSSLLLYSSNSAWQTSDLYNMTKYSISSIPSDVKYFYSTGSAIYYMTFDNTSYAHQLWRSTNGRDFSKLTSFATGDEEYGIPDNPTPNTGFMSSGTVSIFELNSRLYLLHDNKSVMSAPTNNPTNLRAEANSNIPAYSVAVYGDITETATTPDPLTTTSSFSANSGFSASSIVSGSPNPLTGQATFSSAGGFTALAALVALSQIDTSAVDFSALSEFSAIGQLLSPLTIDGVFSTKAGVLSSAMIYEVPAYELRGNVIRSGINYAGAKVVAIRESDLKAYSTSSDAFGNFSFSVDMGNYFIMVVYVNGADIKITQPKYTVVN